MSRNGNYEYDERSPIFRAFNPQVDRDYGKQATKVCVTAYSPTSLEEKLEIQKFTSKYFREQIAKLQKELEANEVKVKQIEDEITNKGEE